MVHEHDTRGTALARALAARGIDCSPCDAERLTDLLLDLVAAGLLRTASPLEPSTGHGPQDRPGPVDGSREPDPTVYNMGSAKYIGDDYE